MKVFESEIYGLNGIGCLPFKIVIEESLEQGKRKVEVKKIEYTTAGEKMIENEGLLFATAWTERQTPVMSLGTDDCRGSSLMFDFGGPFLDIMKKGGKTVLFVYDENVDDYVDETGHTPGEWVVTVPATSLTDGTKVLKCSVCTAVLDTQSISRFGSVNSVSIDNLSMQYKTSLALTPAITVDSGVEYTVAYSSSDPSVATVDENGNVYAAGKGTAEITCTVTDEYGNVASDTATVEVKYVWWQWIIVILLFGWIWY